MLAHLKSVNQIIQGGRLATWVGTGMGKLWHVLHMCIVVLLCWVVLWCCCSPSSWTAWIICSNDYIEFWWVSCKRPEWAMIHDQKSTKSQLIRQSVTKCSNLRLVAKLPNMLRPAKGPKLFMDLGVLGTKVFLKVKECHKSGNFGHIANTKYVLGCNW